ARLLETRRAEPPRTAGEREVAGRQARHGARDRRRFRSAPCARGPRAGADRGHHHRAREKKDGADRRITPIARHCELPTAMKGCVMRKSAMRIAIETTPAVRVGLVPTPSVPPRVSSPKWHPRIAMRYPNTGVFAMPEKKSAN